MDRVILFTAFLLFVVGCSPAEDEARVVLDGSYADYDTYANALLEPLPTFSGRSLYFHDSRYVLSFEVDCNQLPIDSPSKVELLRVPGSVNVKEWITYRMADYANVYSEIVPERYALVSGRVKLKDVEVQEVTRGRGEQEITVEQISYRAAGENLVFEGDVQVPTFETGEHSCYRREGWSGS